MEIVKAIILGIVQGLTEFLPVSSSGHLEIAKYILGEDAVGEESLLMTVVLHFATALSTVIVFRKFIWDTFAHSFKKGQQGIESRKYVLLIFLSMIPAVLVGLLLEDFIESLFGNNLTLVCLMLILTGLLLYIADRAQHTEKSVTTMNAIIIGIAQAIAILPGISRSGATISISVLLGIDREKAARFSFLIVIPLIFGKIAKDLLDGSFNTTAVSTLELGAGFMGALVTGFFACTWMINIVKNSQLKYFSYYCFLIAAIGLSYLYIF